MIDRLLSSPHPDLLPFEGEKGPKGIESVYILERIISLADLLSTACGGEALGEEGITHTPRKSYGSSGSE
jgi:hypothetical protein